MDIIIVIFIISFLVIIHELGHYFAAVLTGTNVEEFGLGYPPRLFKLFVFKGTQFTLNAIPFGGFVRLEGEMGRDDSLDKKESYQGAFFNKSSFERLAITLAGIVTNVVFALIAFSIVYSFMGIPLSLYDQARIGEIAPNSPAAEANLPVNVNILEIKTDTNFYSIENFEDVQRTVADNKGKNLEIVVSGTCEGNVCHDLRESYQVYARTQEETPEGEGSIGVGFLDATFQYYPWYEMPFRGTWFGIQQAVGLGWMILQALIDMFVGLFTRGVLPQDVAGPVGIIHETQKGNVISDSFLANLGFAGMLSLNLAIMNLLPIPALDGGRAIFIMLEKIIGKKIVEKVEGYANYVGFALLILLIVTITIKDVVKIFNG